MPFVLRISKCCQGHEISVHAEPLGGDEISLTWNCYECEAARASAEKSEAPELRNDEAVGSGGDEPRDMVRKEEEARLHHVYELVDGRNNCVFYVGVTMNPNARFSDHGMPNSSSAALPRIQEIRQGGGEHYMRIVASFNDRRRAEAYEALLISETTGVVNRVTPPLRSVAAV